MNSLSFIPTHPYILTCKLQTQILRLHITDKLLNNLDTSMGLNADHQLCWEEWSPPRTFCCSCGKVGSVSPGQTSNVFQRPPHKRRSWPNQWAFRAQGGGCHFQSQSKCSGAMVQAWPQWLGGCQDPPHLQGIDCCKHQCIDPSPIIQCVFSGWSPGKKLKLVFIKHV
jgi:hypothetical protein